MQFSALTLAALASLASAQTVHVVTVAKNGASGTEAFNPSNLTAAPGDVVMYQFMSARHGVVQSNFDNTCAPISVSNKSVAGFSSGIITANASTTEVATFAVMINSTDPIWIYCPVATHCEDGMSMVINENTSANASRSLENYRTASKSSKTVMPIGAFGGNTSDTSSTSNSSSSGSNSTSTSSSSSGTPTGNSAAVWVPSTFGLLTALGAVFVL